MHMQVAALYRLAHCYYYYDYRELSTDISGNDDDNDGGGRGQQSN